MKKSSPNQRTLFQSWSKQSISHCTSTGQEAQTKTGFDHLDIIELGDDDEDDGLLAAAMEMEIVDDNGLAQTTTYSPKNVPTSTNSFSPEEIEQIPGFDLETGNVWIYPTNYPIRGYQFQIVEKALMMNTLVTLPTGLGKTFIAAVLMYNYYRWYPQGKIIFMAPTKPLVAQQIEACYNIMGIPESDTTELTGHMPPNKRGALWKSKRVFFLTAQVLNNDLGRGSCDAKHVVLLVFDEAHKALGNHAYCQVIREVHSCTRNFRVLALSATPGDDIKAVQQVMSNLLISHMELRSEDSPDIQAYTHKRTVDKIVVPLGEDITRIKTQFLKVLEGIVGRLFCNRALWQKDPQNVTKFMLLTGRNKFREREAEGYTNGQKGAIEGDFAMAISLYHAYELLHQHGILSFYNFIKAIVDGSKGMARARTEIMRHTDFMDVMNELRELIEKPPDEMSAETSVLFSQFTSPRRRSMMREAFDPSFKSHPKLLKLEEVIVEHFQNFADEKLGASTSATDCVKEVNTRVMIFSQYRDSVGEITAILNKHKPLVRVMSFIGQASTGKSSRGLSQKEQLEVVQRFRKGGYNTLVATCVGEEGLDIGDVDLIVCFDAHASPIRLVQRMGRTGRKRNGRIVVLVTEGKEEQVYKRSLSSKNSIHKAIKQGKKSFVFYDDNPRMIPRHLTPRVHKMEMTVDKYVGIAKKKCKSNTDCNKSNIKTLLSTSTTSKPSCSTRKDDAFLNDKEFDYWQKNFKLPNSVLNSTSNKRRSANSSCDSVVKELSLSEWMPWQNVPSPVGTITHSRRTEHLIEILEFIELHNDEDDAYDVEMMSFLNEEDIVSIGPGNNTEEGPLIFLDDEEDPIQVGKCKGKGKIESNEKKENSNAAEIRNKKICKEKTKVASAKEKIKSKISKKPPPSRKWKDYLKTLQNEDNDFERVEKSPVLNEATCKPMVSLGRDDIRDEQCRVDVNTNEKGGMKPLKKNDEEIDDDDSLLSSQQVSELLPSVTPSNAFLFHSKIFDMKNSVRDVPTPPSLDSLNELSPYVCDVTGESFKDRLDQPIRHKESVCRRNIQKDTKMKCYKSKTIIEEPPNDFELNDGEMISNNTSVKNTMNVIQDPPISFEFDECKEDAKKYHESEDIPVFKNNFKLERVQRKDTAFTNDLLDVSCGLFDVDLSDILNDNESEKIELDDMMVTDKEVDKKQGSTPRTTGPMRIENIGDEFNKPMNNSIHRCIDGEVYTSNFSKPFKGCSENIHNSIHGFPEDKIQQNKPGDAQCRTTKTNEESIGVEPICKPKGEWHENYKDKTSKKLENSKTFSKTLRTNLTSSLSKLNAFERNAKGSDSNGIEKKVESTKASLKAISEITRMSPTSKRRTNENFDFKKPWDFSLTHRPKSSGMNEIDKIDVCEKRASPGLKLPIASTKLSLKKTIPSRSLEKCKQDSVGKIKPQIEKEKGQRQTRAILNDESNIQNEISTVKGGFSVEANMNPSNESTLPICAPQESIPKGTGLNAKQIELFRKTSGIVHTVDEDSPIMRSRSKSKKRPAISSPISPAYSTPVSSRNTNAVDRESPLIRRRSKVMTKNGDIVAIAESEEDDDIEDDPTENLSALNREGIRKAKPLGQDKKSKRRMILSDSEEEFENGNFRKGSKENAIGHSRNPKMRQQTSVKRKRQHCDVTSKKRKTHRLNDFLDEEAELSGSDIEDISDDESEGSELDSFIDDSTQLTQVTPTQANPKIRKSKPDMLAVYRQSLLSPHARDLNFKTPTMCRNKNRYKMKYGVENNDESASEAEETYSRESDLENEFASDSDCDLNESCDVLSVEDDEEESWDSKDSTPIASQVCRPLKRVKRKRILNESIEETERIVNPQSSIVPQSNYDVHKSKHVCPPKNSPFATSSTLVNRGSDMVLTSENTPLNMPSNLYGKLVVNDTNWSLDNSTIIQDKSFSTTFEFDWGLDFSDTDLLHAVQDEKKRVDDETITQAALKNATKKPDVCDNEMQEIAFAMAATDDVVNLEMSEMPTFSLGLDLFGNDADDKNGEGKADTSEKQNKNISSVSNPTNQVYYKEHFTKISPSSSATTNYVSLLSSSKANGDCSHVLKNNVLPTARQYINTENHSTGKSMKDISLSWGHQANPNGTSCRNQNMESVGTNIVKQNKSLSSSDSIKEDNNPSSDQSNIKIELSIQRSISNSTRSLFQNKQHKNDNVVCSVVRPNAEDNEWSCTTTSSKGISYTRTNGLKDVNNINSFKSIPTAFVSPAQKDNGKLVILADTKEISNSKIVPTLRRSHNIKVEVCQLQNCDYVVSNRMGVNRKLTSVVANSSNSTKILDKMRLLCDLYDRPCFIIEKDRVKPGETERDFSKSSAYVYTLACMAQTHIKVLFSQSQEETASLLTNLATLEAKKNTHIVAPIALNKETQQVFRFLLTIPHVSYVTALNICSSLRTLRDIFSCSPEDLLKSMRQLSESRTSAIHKYLRHEFTESMVDKNTRKST